MLKAVEFYAKNRVPFFVRAKVQRGPVIQCNCIYIAMQSSCIRRSVRIQSMNEFLSSDEYGNSGSTLNRRQSLNGKTVAHYKFPNADY